MKTPAPTLTLANGSRITAVASAAAGAARGLDRPALVCHVVHSTPEEWMKEKSVDVLAVYDPDFFTASHAERAAWLEGQLGFKPKTWEVVARAFSVRQPWGWAILHAGKPVENRTRRFCMPGWYYLHASAPVPKREYFAAAHFMERQPKVSAPPFETMSTTHAMPTSALIGIIQITGWTKHTESPWFVGPCAAEIGLTFPLAQPIPASGSQGVFFPMKHLKP